MNYNTLTKKMLYIKNDSLWEITVSSGIDVIILNNRIFIPAGKVFYEVISFNKLPLFIQHRIRILQNPKEAGYNSTSETSAVTNYSNIISSTGTHYNLSIAESTRSEIIDLFWLKKDDKYYKANNIKQVTRLFPEKSTEIKSYVKSVDTDFNDPEDIIRLIDFCNR